MTWSAFRRLSCTAPFRLGDPSRWLIANRRYSRLQICGTVPRSGAMTSSRPRYWALESAGACGIGVRLSLYPWSLSFSSLFGRARERAGHSCRLNGYAEEADFALGNGRNRCGSARGRIGRAQFQAEGWRCTRFEPEQRSNRDAWLSRNYSEAEPLIFANPR